MSVIWPESLAASQMTKKKKGNKYWPKEYRSQQESKTRGVSKALFCNHLLSQLLVHSTHSGDSLNPVMWLNPPLANYLGETPNHKGSTTVTLGTMAPAREPLRDISTKPY